MPLDKPLMCKFAGRNPSKIDFAIPQSLYDAVNKFKNENNAPFDPRNLAFSYESKSYGEAININDEFIYALSEREIDFNKFMKYLKDEFGDIKELNYDYIHINLAFIIMRMIEADTFKPIKE